jgi:hypothetical protein
MPRFLMQDQYLTKLRISSKKSTSKAQKVKEYIICLLLTSLNSVIEDLVDMNAGYRLQSNLKDKLQRC